MIKTVDRISRVKKAIDEFRGEEVRVKVNLGRNKFVSYKGRITGVYHALFTVLPQEEYIGKTSFSYAEVLCRQVIIKKIK